MSAAEKFKAAKEVLNKAREEANAIIKEAFSEMAKVVFDNNPELKGFRWTQYTPYFNDGDACTFSAGTDYYDILHPADESNGGYEDDEWINDPSWWGEYENLQSPLRKADTEIREFFKTFSDDDFLEMFGDHVQVTVTPEGVEVEDHDHD